jgi:hypothetical protein
VIEPPSRLIGIRWFAVSTNPVPTGLVALRAASTT